MFMCMCVCVPRMCVVYLYTVITNNDFNTEQRKVSKKMFYSEVSKMHCKVEKESCHTERILLTYIQTH